MLASEVEMYKGPSQEAIDASKDALGVVSTKRKRGRPKGCHNKPKPNHTNFPHPNELEVMLRSQLIATDDIGLLSDLISVLGTTLKSAKRKLRDRALKLCR